MKCANCGREFYLPKCRLPKNNEYRYCSRECKHKHSILLTIKKWEQKYNICSMKNWLYEKYTLEQKTIREIMKILGTKTNKSIMNFLYYYKIPIRHGSEAINMQYIGSKGIKRRKISHNMASTILQSDKSRNKLRKIMKSIEYKEKMSVANSGKNNGMFGKIRELNPKWNPNLTDEERIRTRKEFENYIFRKKVLKRDDYTCRVTGIRDEKDVVVHHLNGYNWCKNDRYDVSNGITLLTCIHKLFHKYYGYGKNTKEQFKEFVKRFDNHEFDEDLKIIC